MTFSGPAARRFFAVLAVIAVAYPVAASIVHAVGAPRSGSEPLKLALSPFFDVVYSESLPFMIAAVGIGTFSPALGVLFLAVFIPADLIAAGTASFELREFVWQKMGPLPRPYLARTISYGLLWILAVEIPVLARGWASAWAGRGGRRPSVIAGGVGRVSATAVLVFLWAGALPWLIQPVFTWTGQQLSTPWASDPTWRYWPILVGAGIVIAGVSAVWPRPAWLPAVSAPARPVRSMGQVLVRQTVAMAIVALLLGGLMTSVREALILIAGLLLAGPVLTLVLPHVPVPAAVARAPRAARWVVAIVIALGVTWVMLRLTGRGVYEGYFALAVMLAAVAPLCRLLLEAGAGRAGVSTVLLLALGLWLAFPSPAWADNCSSPGDAADSLKACLRLLSIAPTIMLAFAMFMVFKSLGAFDPPPPPAPPTDFTSERPPWLQPPSDPGLGDFDKQQAEKTSFTRGTSDKFKNIQKGTGDFTGR